MTYRQDLDSGWTLRAIPDQTPSDAPAVITRALIPAQVREPCTPTCSRRA